MPQDTTLTITPTTTNDEIYAEVCRYFASISGRHDSDAKRNANAAECDGYMKSLFTERRAMRQTATQHKEAA